MKAIVYHEYGSADVLSLQEVATPSPNDNEVLVHVRAVSINDWDLALLNGDFVNRMMSGWRRPKKTIVGSDVAGVVIEIGKGVTKFSKGDRVYGDLSGRWGGFAEYVCAPETSLASMPERMTFEEAAAIPQAAMLAIQGLIDVGQLKRNQKILINGAGGGVGTFGLQIAKLFGAEVTGVDAAEKLPMMKSLGFDHVIDYRTTDFTRTGETYDLILDAKTNRSVFDYTRALKPDGVYATVGGEIPRLLKILLASPIVSLLYKRKMKIVALKPNKDLPYVNQLYNDGKLKAVIDQTFPLERAKDAMKYYESAQHKGKVVITNPV